MRGAVSVSGFLTVPTGSQVSDDLFNGFSGVLNPFTAVSSRAQGFGDPQKTGVGGVAREVKPR